MVKKGSRTLIIAEAGVNHNGDLNSALTMIDAAADAGADVVKFQSFSASALATSSAALADYQLANSKEINQLELLKALELSANDHFTLKQRCDERSIEFLSTAFDLQSLNFINNIGIQRVKIPSGEITNLPYLREVANLNLPVIMSTGMASLGEIESALEVLLASGLRREKITILHCTTDYPASLLDVNLNAMKTLGKCFGTAYGYSDHTIGVNISIAAVALGASVIEKHFTLDKSLPGPDHSASLSVKELEIMVRGIREIEEALGSEQKLVTSEEAKNKAKVRKSLFAAKNISKGECFSEENIIAKRPATGLSPMCWDTVIGSIAKKDFAIDEPISL